MILTAFMFNGLFLGISALICILAVIFMVVIMALKDTKNISVILKQILSARWILAVLAGISFLAFCASTTIAVVAQRDAFKPETIVSILGMLLLVIQGVYKDYFHRTRDNETGITNGTDAPITPPTPEAPETPVVPEVKPEEPKVDKPI